MSRSLSSSRASRGPVGSCGLRTCFSDFHLFTPFLASFFFFPFPPPTRGGRSADRRPDAASAPGCVHDRTRALTFAARARRRSYPTPRLSALHRDVFWTRPSTLLSFFPGPGSNGCSWGPASRDAGRCPPAGGRKPRRGRHTLLRLTGPPPVDAPHEQGWRGVYMICSQQSRYKFEMRAPKTRRRIPTCRRWRTLASGADLRRGVSGPRDMAGAARERIAR
jgi:hypothetical protein